MKRSGLIWHFLFFPALVYFPQSDFPPQDTFISAFSSSDTLSIIKEKYLKNEESIPEVIIEVPDSILFRDRSIFTSTHYSSLIDKLPHNSHSVINKPEWITTSILVDQARLWASPLRIQKKDLLFWIPVITASAVTACFDEKIYSAFKDFHDRHKWVSECGPVITEGGNDVFVLSATGLIYMSGVLSGKEKAKQTGLIALQAWANAGIIVKVGKLIFGRQRPSYEVGKDGWHGFPASLNGFKGEPYSKYDAFPSGHTIEAWAFATVIAERYKDIKIIPVISYSLATGVGLSRVTEDAHWLSDVIMGAALGYSIGKFMVREKKDAHWTLLPKATGDNMKLIAVYSF